MIHKKEFVLNKHYYKPKAKIILFKWSAIEKWLEGDNPDLNESLYIRIRKDNTSASYYKSSREKLIYLMVKK
jgi:hypothetical protein